MLTALALKEKRFAIRSQQVAQRFPADDPTTVHHRGLPVPLSCLVEREATLALYDAERYALTPSTNAQVIATSSRCSPHLQRTMAVAEVFGYPLARLDVINHALAEASGSGVLLHGAQTLRI